MGFIFFISILLIGASIIGFFVVISDEESRKYFWIPIFIGLMFLSLSVYIEKSDEERALYSTNIKVKHAMVNEVNLQTITLDGNRFVKNNGIIEIKYPIQFENYKVGEIVRYEVINSDFHTYLINIDKITSN